MPFPIIAALDGVAVGGGLELAMAADLRVAQDQIMLGLPETKLAILPGAGGTQRLARLVGPSKAKEMVFLAKLIPGSEAYRLGLVNECVPSPPKQASGNIAANTQKNQPEHNLKPQDTEPAYNRSLELAKEILQKGPVAIKMSKIAIMAGMEVDMNAALAIEEMCYAQVIPTVDRLEGKLANLT